MQRRRTKRNPSFWGIDPKAVTRGAAVLIAVTIIREAFMRSVVNPYLDAALPGTAYAPTPPVEKVVAAVTGGEIGDAIASAVASVNVAGLGER